MKLKSASNDLTKRYFDVALAVPLSMNWADKSRLDLHYVDHRTFIGALRILLGTVRSIARRDGISETVKPRVRSSSVNLTTRRR